MNAKHLFAFATLAFAGTAAMADDITIVNDTFHSQLSRAEVQAQVLQARAAGVLQFTSEFDSLVQAAQPMAKSTLTRDAVRAEVLKSPRGQAMAYNSAA
jgi:uncharacterized protein YqiB (DUF1249 family)